MAASTSPSPTAPTPNAASTCRSSPAARRSTTARSCWPTASSSTWAATCCRPSTPPAEEHPGRQRRRDLPEAPAGHPRPSRRRRQLGRAEGPDAPDRGQRLHLLLPVDDRRARLHRRAAPALHLQPAPFLADDQLGMQGYLSSEPYLVETEGGFVPNVFLIADAGYSSYATTIETMQATIDESPEVVECFVERLDPRLVQLPLRRQRRRQRDDPGGQPRHDPGQDRLRHRQDDRMGHRRFRRRAGAGHRRDDRRGRGGFYEDMVEIGVVEDGLDWSYTINTSFVNQGLGHRARPAEEGATQGGLSRLARHEMVAAGQVPPRLAAT
jgi:hypothetical protein